MSSSWSLVVVVVVVAGMFCSQLTALTDCPRLQPHWEPDFVLLWSVMRMCYCSLQFKLWLELGSIILLATQRF